MLKNELTNLNGKHAVIIGRSNIVGKPMASLLLSSNCTVTVTHSKTKNLADLCKRADILVAAIGRPAMVNENYIKENATVLDVGINRVENNDHKSSQKKYTLVGDVDYDRVIDKVGKITPVPGGVGPMTIACLMHNTLKAAFLRKKEKFINIIEGF
jgi:methylenetetrahydrofolate dehydrogenase (NADP+)/methenyltetrahydrofolate cyclohydrolase